MEEASWANCQSEFAFDGSLVDLIVIGTEPAHWESFWTALRSGPFGLQAYRDGESIPLPATAEWAFVEREVASVTVQVMAGTVNIKCHFFGGELELDLDPREVVGERAFDSVLALMRLVAASVGLPILATSEGGGAEYGFLRVSPDGRAVFLPPRSRPS